MMRQCHKGFLQYATAHIETKQMKKAMTHLNNLFTD